MAVFVATGVTQRNGVLVFSGDAFGASRVTDLNTAVFNMFKHGWYHGGLIHAGWR